MELPGFDTAKEVQAAIKRAQDLMRPYRQGGRSLVDELLPNAVLRPRVSKYVLDTSAVLALLDRERGADRIGAAVAESVIGTVNLAEVHSKLTERGKAGRQALAEILAVMDAVVPFTEEHTAITGRLRAETQHLGLSLGDCACLALGIALGAEVYTAERLWASLKLPCPIHVIR